MSKRQYTGGFPGQMGYPQMMGGFPQAGYGQTGFPQMGGYPYGGYGHSGYPQMGGMPHMGGYPQMGGVQPSGQSFGQGYQAGYPYGMTSIPQTGFGTSPSGFSSQTQGQRKEKK